MFELTLLLIFAYAAYKIVQHSDKKNGGNSED